ncbi:unnamed protein product [Oikopleura dioica]|uniref:Peroxisomal trans-2-enoyl-CoA reductase n=1 Tax=Oikopleura dioica TaxID=34765 RepID=E4Y4I1_OIKDI|nr:unnamed protein product [Oikopleura dioica]
MASKLFRPGYFAGKVNVVTGGGSGIGLGIAEGLVELGSKVVIASRSPERIEEATQLLSSKCQDGAEVLGLQCNIRSRESVKQMISDTISHFGRVDGLVNNGGGQFHSPAENISANGFHAVVETNLYGTYHCMMEAFEQHMKENGGKIVNIVTINRMGMAGMAHSGAARAGVKNLSMSLGAEWAKYGIIINNVAPGTIHSDTAQANYGPLGELLFDGAVQTIPMGRLGSTTDDLAPSVIFMLSEGAKYTTGQTLDVCGGQSLHNNYRQGLVLLEEFMKKQQE